MAQNKLVTIYGATGVQGGAALNSLADNKAGEFRLRAISRNPASENAKQLAARDVEVVKGDGFIKQDMLNAFKGSWAVFVNTNSSDPRFDEASGIRERDLGKIIVDAAFEAGVQHFVYSGLVSSTLLTNGEVSSSAFDEKYDVGEYAKSKGFKSVVIVATGWYMENHTISPEFSDLMGGFPLNPDEEGYLTLRLPSVGGNEEIPFIAMEADFGDLVHGVLLEPERYNGQLVQAVSELARPEKLVEEFQSLTGKPSRYIRQEDWKSIETYGNPDILAFKTMFGFCQYTGGLYFGVPSDTTAAKQLKANAVAAKGLISDEYPLQTLKAFLQQNFSQSPNAEAVGVSAN